MHSGPRHAAAAYSWRCPCRDLPRPLVLKLQDVPDVDLPRWLDDCERARVCNVVAYLATVLRDEDLGKTEDNSAWKVPTAPGESDVGDLEPTSPVASDDVQPVPY